MKKNIIGLNFWGNLSVVISNPAMRSTTNILILNLAIADLLFVVFCIPFTASDYIYEDWQFGNFWCKFVSIHSNFSVQNSIISCEFAEKLYQTCQIEILLTSRFNT